MHEYTLEELVKHSSYDLALYILQQQKLLIECNEVLTQAIKTLEELKENSK